MAPSLFTPSTFTKKRDNSESRLHIATVDYLRGELRNGKATIKLQAPFPGLLFTHPVGEAKDDTERYWSARKGYRPGTPDLVLWERINGISTMMAIELKNKTGSQSPSQRQFQIEFEGKGGKYAICRKVCEVRDTLKGWGLKCYYENCIEPRMSHEEMLAMQKEIYRP